MSPLRFRIRFLCGALTLMMVLAGCAFWSGSTPEGESVYRESMRALVTEIAEVARQTAPGFLVVPQNGEGLLTFGGDADDPWASDYAGTIDGLGREELLFGYVDDNRPTPAAARDAMTGLLDLAESHGIDVLVTDYCWSPDLVADSYQQNALRGYVSFASPGREMNRVPAFPGEPFHANTRDIVRLSDVANFLYLINPSTFSDRTEFLSVLNDSGYDLLILDLYYEDGIALTSLEVEELKTKPLGGRRIVLAYLSIGEAEDYREYWRPEWAVNPPSWLLEENPDWGGNYKVQYWDPAWWEILIGEEDSYLQRVLDAGFDGVYLDLVDAYEFFESR